MRSCSGSGSAAWTGHAPILEEDLALTNVALDLVGQARLWLAYAGETEGLGRDEDRLAYFRDVREYRNVLLVEQPNGDYAATLARQFLFDTWHFICSRLSVRRETSDSPGSRKRRCAKSLITCGAAANGSCVWATAPN